MSQSYQYICGTCNKEFTLRSHPKRIKLTDGKPRCASCRSIWRWQVSPRSGWKRESPSPEVRARISTTLKGRASPLKGLKTGRPAWNKGVSHSPETRAKLRVAQLGREPTNKGKPVSEEMRAKIRASLKIARLTRPHHRGYKWSDEQRKRLSDAKKGLPSPMRGKPSKRRGPLHHNWKGGVTIERNAIRNCVEYHEWRRQIFERDKFKCQTCGARRHLEADHIKPFALFPEIRFDVSNGQTLCYKCHKIKTAEDRKLYKAA